MGTAPGASGTAEVHTKRTSQCVPLAQASLHHPAVHKSWPKAQIARFLRLCKRYDAAENEVRVFEHQLKAAGARLSPSHQLCLGTHSLQAGVGRVRVLTILLESQSHDHRPASELRNK